MNLLSVCPVSYGHDGVLNERSFFLDLPTGREMDAALLEHASMVKIVSFAEAFQASSTL